ncbi:hypothetical protein LIBAT_17295 [Leptospira interrogans]
MNFRNLRPKFPFVDLNIVPKIEIKENSIKIIGIVNSRIIAKKDTPPLVRSNNGYSEAAITKIIKNRLIIISGSIVLRTRFGQEKYGTVFNGMIGEQSHSSELSEMESSMTIGTYCNRVIYCIFSTH